MPWPPGALGPRERGCAGHSCEEAASSQPHWGLHSADLPAQRSPPAWTATRSSCIAEAEAPARPLLPCPLLRPAPAEGGGHVHFMFVFRDPYNDAGYDDNISLSYKLPVRDK